MNRVKNTISSLQGRQNGVTPSVDRFLLEHGDESIKEFIISRNVLSPIITGSIGISSPSAKLKNNNNPLYHLKVLIKTERTSLSLEKNARIGISKYQMNPGAENMPVSIPLGITLNSLLANTKQLMGGKFLSYSAYDNNCGHFVLGILRSNNLSTSQNISFTEQTTKNLFTPQLRKITNSITDVAGKFDIIRQGGDIKPAKKRNRWVDHVKQFAKENNIDYCKALCNADCKLQYRKKLTGDGVGSSRVVVSPPEEDYEEDYDPNVPMAETNEVDRKIKKKHQEERFQRIYKEDMDVFLAKQRLSESEKYNRITESEKYNAHLEELEELKN
jgi:hypothetical protein